MCVERDQIDMLIMFWKCRHGTSIKMEEGGKHMLFFYVFSNHIDNCIMAVSLFYGCF